MLKGIGGVLLIPFVIIGISALFGGETVVYNNEPITGVLGLTYMLISWPIATLFGSVVSWLYLSFGLWFYSLFGQIEIDFIGVRTEQDENL